MDQNLKARLIGATALVVLAVLLIPELLSGRKAPPPPREDGAAARDSRTFTIELDRPGGPVATPTPPPAPTTPDKVTATAAPTGELPANDAAPPAATAGPGVAAPPPSEQQAVLPPPAAEPVEKPVPEVAPRAPAGDGDWVVQVGAFGSADTAGRLVRKLEAAGYSARLSPVTRSGKTLHRVRVGPDTGRPAAQQLAERLKAGGLPATVVASD